MKHLFNNLPIYIYINRINNRLVLKIKHGSANTRNHEIIWWHKNVIKQNKQNK